MYSAVLSIIPEELECSIECLVLSAAFLLFATFIGWTSIFTDKEIWARNDHPREMWNYVKQDCLLHGAALVFVVILPFYLLSNNHLPLYHIECDGNLTHASNISVVDNSAEAEHITRLVGMSLTGIIVIIVAILFKWKKQILDTEMFIQIQ